MSVAPLVAEIFAFFCQPVDFSLVLLVQALTITSPPY